MSIGVLTLHIQLPGCTSLKNKRSRLKPLLARLHREFNISVAEIDHQDAWQEAMIACAVVSNDPNHNRQVLQSITQWIENSWPDVFVFEDSIEII
ncbi:MAG: hypothetical protein A2W33_02695 [Chloroflexi bacterium RBG_16_52_11]|nr:MAG: hypothetical protein A2W33_02695 [Chloroflexi bacterium RBG_16_52_11]